MGKEANNIFKVRLVLYKMLINLGSFSYVRRLRYFRYNKEK